MAFVLPLEVDGVAATLTHMKGVEVQVDAGVVRLALTNYTGVLFLSQTAPDGPGDSAAVLSAVEEARGAKRRGRDCPPQTPDPADARTIKKPKGLKADDDEGAWNGVDDEAGSGRSDDLRLESLAHVYEQLDAAASSELIVHGGVEAERGVFALLGNGKNPGKTGAVTVSASGYDPGLKRPEDLTGGRKSGDGCMALPRGDIRGTSPQHRDEVCYFEFELQGGLELKATAYSLRNGSKDYGTYPNAWVLQQCDGDGDWTTIAREAGDELDGNRQALRKFKIEVSPASTPPGFASRFRIKSSGPRLERHPLWLLSLEFFGTLRRKAPCGPSGSTSLPARVTAAGGDAASRRDMDVGDREEYGEEHAEGLSLTTTEGLSLTTIPSSVSCSPESNKTPAANVKSPTEGGVAGAQRGGGGGVGSSGGGSDEHEGASGSAPRLKAAGKVGKGAGGRKQAKADEDLAKGDLKGGDSKAASACKSATKGTPIPMKGIASFFKKA